MRRSRRRRARTKPQRHVSVSATDAEWAVVGANAARRGLSRARYLIGLVERDAGGEDPAPPMALAPDEQRALLEAVRAIHALLTEDASDDAAAAPTPPAVAASPDMADPPGPVERQGRLP